ncbi:MAG: hypothetical protein RL095_2333 [Verrucomicrobiota bacterium]|jgi:hypothetical protein
MKLLCPLCQRPADPTQVNMAELIAYCPDCQETWNFGAKKADDAIDDKVLAKPPSGCSRTRDVEGVVLRTSTRSPAAFFLVPFMCVWSGFSLGGIYGTQIVQGKFNLMMSLFGIPFIAGSVLFWGIALMASIGREEILITRKELRYFIGVGRIGRRKVVALDDLKSVKLGEGENLNGRVSAAIVIEGGTHLPLGGCLSQERRYWLYHALRAEIEATRLKS